MSYYKINLGKQGEALAEEMLISKGYTIVARNVRCNRGELDLIAWERNTLVFVEVRTRRGTRFGSPVESITWKKKQKLRELAFAYLERSGLAVRSFRIDVVAIEIISGQKPRIQHIINAC